MVVNVAAAPDPELGIKIRPETITLSNQAPSAQVSLGYLSLAGGRSIKFGNLPPDVKWTLNAATRTGTLTRQTGAWASNRKLTVQYVDPALGIISQGEWQLNVEAGATTLDPSTYSPVISDLKTWSEGERNVLQFINEVRTNKTLNGDDVTYSPCLIRFPDTTQPVLPVDAGQVAARKQAQYIALEGIDPSVGPDGVRGHFQYDKASPAYYGFSPTDRLTRAVAETPQSKAAGFKGIGENIFGHTHVGTQISARDLAISAVNGWLNSTGHCPQVMDPRYRFIGVGHVYNPSAVTGGNFWQNNVVMAPFF